MRTFPFRPCALLLALAATLAPGLPAAEPVRVNGSGSALEMLKPLVAAYRKSHPQVEIHVGKPLGSSGAIKALLAGALDLAVGSKPANPAEVAQGAIFRDYGQTPLALISGGATGQTGLTSEALAGIYAGATTAWPNGAKIRLVLRPEGDIDTRILQGLSPRMQAAMAEALKKPGMIVAVTDPEANDVVARTPGALGASGLCGLLGDPRPMVVLALNGVMPSVKTLAAGTYPLAKDIRFVTTARTSPEALQFMAFIYSPAGRRLAEKAGVWVQAR